jgi:hypothetical protein
MSPELYQEAEMRFQFEGSMGERAFGFLADAIRKAAEHGNLKKQEVMLAAQTAWSFIHGITSLLITKPKFPWRKKEALIASVVESVRRSGGQWATLSKWRWVRNTIRSRLIRAVERSSGWPSLGPLPASRRSSSPTSPRRRLIRTADGP